MTDKKKTQRVPVTRIHAVPDPYRIERWRRIPELGPKILFFSGGTALRPVSRELKGFTHNSQHLITPFDSGGSSAELRRCFAMPSIGDLRNRLLALADESIQGNPEIYALFSHRLSVEGTSADLRADLQDLVDGKGALVSDLPGSFARIVRTHLRSFLARIDSLAGGGEVPTGAAGGTFDLRGASIGNLLLASGYLDHDRDLDSALFLFSKLLHVRGQVHLVSNVDLHLQATLEDGTTRIGQHLLGNCDTRIEQVELVKGLSDCTPGVASLSEKGRHAIETAELICYPMGSFYSSVIAPLLAAGVSTAIESSGAPKIFVPNTGLDPEQKGISVADAADRLLRVLGKSLEDPEGVLDFIVLDDSDASYETAPDRERLRNSPIHLIEAPLVCSGKEPRIGAKDLTQILLSLI